ncbi:MAG: SH3 domain-containing protein [Bacteroidota bacterium]
MRCIFPLTTFLFVLISFPVVSQSTQVKLAIADSLYSQGSYSQAMQVYEDIYFQGQEYTPAMLLRMAFLSERRQQYPETLFYLNSYFIKTGDRAVFEKITSLASTYTLEGYDSGDWSYFLSLVYTYLPWITGGLLVAISMLVFLMAFRRWKAKERPKVLPWVTFVVSALYMMLINTHFFQAGIIQSDYTLLMEGPSAGSNVLEVLDKGHQLTLIEKEDVWWKVEWTGGREGYVKEGQLLELVEKEKP